MCGCPVAAAVSHLALTLIPNIDKDIQLEPIIYYSIENIKYFFSRIILW